jgi:hypothetical protein
MAAHWADCTDETPTPQGTARMRGHQAEGLEEA